ncbi:glycosyltransferase WbuB [Micromonospora zingiberis]|uniref:Glycosyltransferase WbuB n=1 Tax=Micromonospora zingiberis TaxID=2053011 RepID=A0A4R0GKD8_9ACTN|nr:glycosyltransferase family 4 protein [Micromonospora zingiberis]TCB95929.1 glycosyltransferase WbuB [Micromonospora zingiberis]
MSDHPQSRPAWRGVALRHDDVVDPGDLGHRRDDPVGTRVAFLTQCFHPEPAAIPLGITRSLRAHGMRVQVLTGIPNYPTGKIRQGYSAWRRTSERHDDLHVLRTPLYPSHDRSAAGRAINYVSWAASSTFLGRSVRRHADVALVYGSPITAATSAIAARLRRRMPYVLMVMDLWPDSVFATGFLTGGVKRRIAESALTRLTNLAYRFADHVTVPAPGIRDAIVARGVRPDKVTVVYNWTDEKVMQPTAPDPLFRTRLGLAPDDFVLMYAGNLGSAQRLDVVVEAMARLSDVPHVHLVLIGDGVERQNLRDQAERLGLARVHLVDPVVPQVLPAILAAADLHLVSLADDPLFRITLPSKLQALLACGQPILVCAPGDAARIVTEAGAGFTAPPEDPVRLAEVLRQGLQTPRPQLRAMGRAGHDYYHLHMSEAANTRLLADVITTAANRVRRTR